MYVDLFSRRRAFGHWAFRHFKFAIINDKKKKAREVEVQSAKCDHAITLQTINDRGATVCENNRAILIVMGRNK